MEEFLQGLGIVAFVLLGVIGAVAGWIAGFIAGRRRALYVIVGIVAAMATPFVLAGLGVGLLAAGGLLVLLVTGAIGAVLVLMLVRLLTSSSDKT